MGKRLSGKPTVYLIDGSNFVMRFGEKPFNIAEDEFTVWLKYALETDTLCNAEFRVVFDGPCRRTGPVCSQILVYYTDSEPADEYIIESGVYLNSVGVRAVIVTSDNGLRDRAREDSVLNMSCEFFLRLVQKEIDKCTR